MKARVSARRLLMALILAGALLVQGGCSSARQKWDDAKRYFLDEVVRW